MKEQREGQREGRGSEGAEGGGLEQLEWSGNVYTYIICKEYHMQSLSLESLTKVKHSCFVIPLSLLWGFLSNEAIDAIVLRALGEGGKRHTVIIICL